jgi:hypothetical protein
MHAAAEQAPAARVTATPRFLPAHVTCQIALKMKTSNSKLATSRNSVSFHWFLQGQAI